MELKTIGGVALFLLLIWWNWGTIYFLLISTWCMLLPNPTCSQKIADSGGWMIYGAVLGLIVAPFLLILKSITR